MKEFEVWLFVEFIREGDYPSNPRYPRLFTNFDEMKEYSAICSGYDRGVNNKNYASTYVKITKW